MLLVAPGLTGCASVHETTATEGAMSDRLATLDGGLDSLVGRFNEGADKPRIVALLSPS